VRAIANIFSAQCAFPTQRIGRDLVQGFFKVPINFHPARTPGTHQTASWNTRAFRSSRSRCRSAARLL